MSFFSTTLTRIRNTLSAWAEKIKHVWQAAQSWHNRTLTRIKTWWTDKQSWHNRAWKAVSTWWKDENAWHHQAAKRIQSWWASSYLKKAYLWLHDHFNRLMEASLPFSRTVNFLKNWIQGFAFLWGLIMVYVLAADPMLILAGGALAISNVAFAAAILIAFAYAYYHYRSEKNQAAVAEKQRVHEEEINALKKRVVELEARAPAPAIALSENMSPTVVADVQQKLDRLEARCKALETTGAGQTEFLVQHGYCPVYESDEPPPTTEYGCHDGQRQHTKRQDVRCSYIN